ncbi:uncharacterized protein DFL_003780 [Arthrobotrys flagrans]|uniref:Uncharacterized protein n=1 Tax=Arthrobotrys flagrans TaxID=97331 RepID=A0A437A2U0_ARTFL|nr:hypothetical protein DFL_003780 [Arthrobotrys flagrans]
MGGNALSVPELSYGGTYYIGPAGANAGDAFGVPAIFTTDFFTLRRWTVIQIADEHVTDGTTFPTNAYKTVLGGPTTVTQTTTVDDNPATTTVTHVSYGRTRHVDVPVTSYTTVTNYPTSCPLLSG